MPHLRRLLVPTATVWLCCQIGTVVSVPLVLISEAMPYAEECACGHGDGAMCPMHQKSTGRSAPCALQAANGPGTTILTPLVGAAGRISELSVSIRPAEPSMHALPADARVIGERPLPPDPPPPRV